MDVVIAGAGVLGINLAKTLITENMNVTIIENDPGVFAKAENELDALFIKGNAAVLSTLEECNLRDKDYFIAVTGNDEINIISSILAKMICGIKTIARFSNLEYTDMIENNTELVHNLGIDFTVNTNMTAAKEILRLIHVPTALDLNHFVRGSIEMVELNVAENSKAVDKSLNEKFMPPRSIIAAINREGKIIIPSGDIRIQPGDRVIVFYDPSVFKEVQKIFSQELVELDKKDKIFLVGASRIGIELADILEKDGFNVVMIEKDKEACNIAAQKLKKTVIINSDATNEKTLLSESISNASTLVTLTSNDEINLLVSLLAKKLTDIKTISLIHKPDLKSVFEAIGVDVAISMRLSAVSEILKDIKYDISSVAILGEGEFQALEIDISEKSSILNKELKDIKFPKDTLIGLIFREGKSIVPHGNDTIKKGDKLIVLASTDQAMKINGLFR